MTGPERIEIGLNAAIMAIAENAPAILRIPAGSGAAHDALPFGPFDPASHRTMERGLRQWVEEQTGLRLGYVEQLYTFGDRGRHREDGDRQQRQEPHVVSVGYLALTLPGHVLMTLAILLRGAMKGHASPVWHGIVAGLAGLGEIRADRTFGPPIRNVPLAELMAVMVWNPLQLLRRRVAVIPLESEDLTFVLDAVES